MVKLTVVHDNFEPGSTVAEMVSNGWPRVLSDLKTLLETEAITNLAHRDGVDAARERRYGLTVNYNWRIARLLCQADLKIGIADDSARNPIRRTKA